jgi:hypothetical protein
MAIGVNAAFCIAPLRLRVKNQMDIPNSLTQSRKGAKE